MRFTPIYTERLIIRAPRLTDLVQYLSYQSHPDVLRYMRRGPHNIRQAIEFLTSQRDFEFRRNRYQAFAVCLRKNGRMIGDIGFFLANVPELTPEIGFQFDPNYHAQGYGMESATALISFLFGSRGIDRILVSCDEGNARCIRLIGRLLMTRIPQYELGVNSYECSKSTWIKSHPV